MNVKRFLSLVLCAVFAFSMSTVAFAAPEEPFPEDYCEIKGELLTVIGFSRNDKIELYAEYYSNTDENAHLVWTLEGESKFIRTEDDKTSTKDNVIVRFKGESVVRLQLISTNGEVLAEDEVTLKEYVDNTSFWEELPANIMISIMFVIGIIGGTIVPLFSWMWT